MLKRAVDIGGVEMVIQEKAKKEEEKVDVVKEKLVAPQVNRIAEKANTDKDWLIHYPMSSLSSSLMTGRSCSDQGMA